MFDDSACRELAPRRDCPINGVLVRLGEKWTLLTMVALAQAENKILHFADLKRQLPAISQKMLTSTLRTMERDGLVDRHFFPEVPPRTKYELTLRGQDLLASMEGFFGWAHAHWSGILDSRRQYDLEEIRRQ